ncbi:MAG: hypothetical protein ABIH72_03125 [archaeon]
MDPAKVEVHKISTQDMEEAFDKGRILVRSNGSVPDYTSLNQISLIALVTGYSLSVNGCLLVIDIIYSQRPELVTSWRDNDIRTGAHHIKQAKFDFDSLETMERFPSFHYLRLMYQIIDPPLRN